MSFKPTLIDNLETKLFKEDERGKMYALRNPVNSKYIKLHESVFEVVKLFNGNNSVQQISQALKDARVEVSASELVKMLAEEGFIKDIKPPKKKNRGDIFSFKIKFFTLTTRDLAFLEKLFSFVRSRAFKFFYAAFLIVGFSLFIYYLPWIFPTVVSVMGPETSIIPLLLYFVMFHAVEFAHEFAHAVSYYHFGGKSSEVGMEFHFLIPFFYTSTPDAFWMDTRKQIKIFIAGPLTSLLFAEIFTLVFIFEPTQRSVWALHAFFWHISTLITLTPIIRTDGYFIVQAVTKFPNLLEHGVDTIVKAFRVLIRKISLRDFKDHMSQYSAYEKKILRIYVPLFPVITGILMFAFVFTGLEFGMIQMLEMTPQILSGAAQGIKPYVLWLSYVSSIIFSIIGIAGTIINTAKKMRE